MPNLFLRPILEEVILFQNVFNSISFSHVYRENNKDTDSLSKAGLSLDVGSWTVLESRRMGTFRNLSSSLLHNC
jgi:hypothetical protein